MRLRFPYSSAVRASRFFVALALRACLGNVHAEEKEPTFLDPINVTVPAITTDPEVRYDYDVVYVRAPRAGDTTHKQFYAEIARPVYMQPGADLILLHPDGREEVLVSGREKGAVQDPIVSFDGQWVYYALLHDLSEGGQFEPAPGGADIYKIHLATRRIVQLTRQRYLPRVLCS